MSLVTQTIVLKSNLHFGKKVPPEAFGELLRVLPGAICSSIRMAFEARSKRKAADVIPARQGDQFFSQIPKPKRTRFNVHEVIREQQYKKGIGAIFGQWPGDETDEEIAAALKELGFRGQPEKE